MDHTVIKVIGVGDAGNKVVSKLAASETSDVEIIAINTYEVALANYSHADQKILIGEKITKGHGTGSSVDVGRKCAEESRKQLEKTVENANMVLIVAGMGGGTGTGAAPIIAEIAREHGALTIGVVTKPFKFEGARRMEQAEAGIKELLRQADSVIIIPNESLQFVTDEKISYINAFAISDDILYQTVSSIFEPIADSRMINLDFEDVLPIMKGAGLAHIGVGHATGKDRAEAAVRAAAASPLMESAFSDARSVLINITGSSLDGVEQAADIAAKAAHKDATILFSATIDEAMTDELCVTIIAANFRT
jgi:cell division protein FtsZ